MGALGMEAEALAERVERLRGSARLERWKALAPRYALIGLCAILSVAGLKEIVVGEGAPVVRRGGAASGQLAMNQFALGFARLYLSYDASRPAARERALAGYVPEHLEIAAGFSPRRGSQRVLWAEVAQNQEAIGGGRVITVAAQTDRHPTPLYLAVPVRRLRSGALAMTDFPAFVGPPLATTSAGAPIRERVGDDALVAMVERALGNYLGRAQSNLAADLLPDAKVSLPTAPLEVVSVDQILWARGDGGGAVLAQLEAREPGVGSYLLTYEVGVERRGGRWYARWIEVVPTA
jgi:hypothetical protein